MTYAGTIPTDRPVIGKDVDTLRLKKLQIIVADMCFLMGVSPTRWTQRVRQEAELPLMDPSMALLVRAYDAWPELSPIQLPPTPDEMFELLSGIRPISKAEFTACFGAEQTAFYRWKKGAVPSPYSSRLMAALKRLLLSSPEWKRAEVLDDWLSMVAVEGIARGGQGAESPAKTGKWYSDKFKTARAEEEDRLKELESSGEGTVQTRKKGLAAKSEG